MLIVLALAFLAPGHAAEAPEAPAAVAPTAVAPDALVRYDAIRVALLEDRLDDARTAASALAAADQDLAAAADALGRAVDANAARLAFGDLSRAFVLRLSATTPSPRVSVYFCPMWPGYAWWVQPRAGIGNPYMGAAMPECGEQLSLKAAAKAASAPAK